MFVLLNSSLGASFKSFVQLMGTLLIFLFVLLCAYLTSRWMGGYEKAHQTNRNLEIVETIRVGANKMISIVRAGTKYLVVSIGKDEINLLGELSEEELIGMDLSGLGQASVQEPFQELLDKFKEKMPKKRDKNE